MDRLPLLFGAGCFGFFALFLLGFGVFLVVFSLRSKKRAGDSQSWPSTTGRISSASIKESTSTDDDGSVSVAFYPAVEYNYQVNDVRYTGRRLSFGGIQARSSRKPAMAALERYPEDAEVTVYYNPAKPEDAVLERKAGSFTWGLAGGIFLLLLGGCLVCGLLASVVYHTWG